MFSRSTIINFPRSKDSPYVKSNPRLTSGLLHSRQEWKLLCSPLLEDVTADTTLRALMQSASLTQQDQFGVGAKVNIVFFYALVFDTEGKHVLMLYEEKPNGEDDVWTVPNKVIQTKIDGMWKTEEDEAVEKSRVKHALTDALSKDYGILCDKDSAYVVKALVPIRDGPLVSAAVRVYVDPDKVPAGIFGNETPVWASKEDVAAFTEDEVKPAGMKAVIQEAFEQVSFEKEMVAE